MRKRNQTSAHFVITAFLEQVIVDILKSYIESAHENKKPQKEVLKFQKKKSDKLPYEVSGPSIIPRTT